MADNLSPHEFTIEDEKGSDEGSTDTSSWNTSQEDLLKAISERSNCMRWLHTHSYYYFENANFFLTIPNVIISTLNGGFTMSLTSLFPDPGQQKAATTVIGLISIFSAMLITMNQYIKSQQMMESHRAAGLSQGKLYRMISNELALRRDQRTNALEFLKHVRLEQDRLENMSPNILPSVIDRFNILFRDKEIQKPEVVGDLDMVNVNHRMKKDKGVYSPESDTPTINTTSKLLYGSVSKIVPKKSPKISNLSINTLPVELKVPEIVVQP
jgi:hypothetical protein